MKLNPKEKTGGKKHWIILDFFGYGVLMKKGVKI